MSHRTPMDLGPGNRARFYHTVAPLTDSLESVDLDIIEPGDTGDVWELTTMGATVRYIVQEGDTNADVAAGLRLVAGTGVSEVQHVDLGTPTSGTYTLSFRRSAGDAPQTTTPLAWNATAATVQTALIALSNLAPGDVVVTSDGPDGEGRYTLTFGGTLALQNVPQIDIDPTLLMGRTRAPNNYHGRDADGPVGGVTVTGATSHVIITRTAALSTTTAYPGGANAPLLFERLFTAGVGESELVVLDTEPLSGRGELRVRQSVDDPTPLDLVSNPSAVDLGTASNFSILSEDGITSAGTETIDGDIGVSPAAAATIVGFGLTLDGGGQFATSAEVSGSVYASDYAAPTPGMLAVAVGDAQDAYVDAGNRTPDTENLSAGALGGLTLLPGVYHWPGAVTIATDLTFSGASGDRWVLILDSTLALSAATDILLTGGCVPENIVWRVAGATTLGATSHFEGILLALGAVGLGAGATFQGRILTQSTVALDGNSVSQP